MSQKCLTLPDETFATLILENNQTAPFNINDTIKYKCSNGYFFTDSSIVSSKQYPVFTCKLKNSMAIWDFDVKACKPVNCGHPGFVEHADLIGQIFSFPNFVTYKCHEGYKHYDITTRYCTVTGKWTPPIMKIKCIPIICPNLQVPLHGSIHYSNANNYNSIATYSCDKGYCLKGNGTRTCTDREIWDGLNPICEKVTCSKPISNVLQNSWDVGDIFVYTCPQTNQMFVTKCKEDGQWSTKINCNNDSNSVISNDNTNPSITINPISNVSLSSNVNPQSNASLINTVNPSNTNNKNKNANLNNMASLSNITSSKNNLISSNNNSSSNAGNLSSNITSKKSIVPINNIIQEPKENIYGKKFIIFAIICIIILILLIAKTLIR